MDDFLLPHRYIIDGITLQSFSDDWHYQGLELDPKYGYFEIYFEYEEHSWPT